MAMGVAPERSAPPYPGIHDHALIGDGRSAALVSTGGSIDWLCWPRFDSPSVFGAILDKNAGGRFQVRPVGPYVTRRRYIPGTNVLETVFRTERGSVVLRDLMTIAEEDVKQTSLLPEREVLRQVECLSGAVEVEVTFQPRSGYGADHVRLEQRGKLGLWCQYGRGTLVLQGDVPLRIDPARHSARGTTRLRAGESMYLSLAYGEDAPVVIPPLGRQAGERLDRSVRWWHTWAERCTYRGPYRDAVVRSALALKLMVFAPSGAIIAAPTTSLPETLGGERNWDYRYCWLRDASFTIRALMDLGYDEEATAYVSWLLHTTRLTWPNLQVLYDVYGRAKVPERELPHLEGYAGSRPVRVGNDAQGQLQLDVYGEVLDGVLRYVHGGGAIDRGLARYLNGLGHTVCDRWREPDEGIWEGRSGRSHHTHSKVLCWVALDRLIALNDLSGFPLDVGRFLFERDAIRREVEQLGYNERIASYTQVFGQEDVDASLLTLPLYGYIDAADQRMAGTLTRIQEVLGRDPLVYRYAEGTDDGLRGREGAFGVCGFWAVECRAMCGDMEGARAAFERLLGYGNDVGLFAEEMDPVTGEGLGNFPQAFTHVGVINAALTLAGDSPAYGRGVVRKDQR